MVKIILENSYSRIQCNKELLKQLRDVFSYIDFSSVRYTKFPKTHRAIDAKGFFGTGLIRALSKYLKSIQCPVEIIDTRRIPELGSEKLYIKSILPEPYPEQSKAIEQLISNHTGVVTLPTGCGKSLVATLAINKLKLKTVIITPNLNLKNQLYRDLRSSFGHDKVNLLGQKTKQITIANIQSLESYPEDIFEDKDFLIVDEVHHSAAKSYIKANKEKFTSIYYRLGLTATPYRNNKQENIFLSSFLSSPLLELTSEEAIKSNYIVKPIFTCLKVNYTREEIAKVESLGRASYNTIRQNLVNSSNTFHKLLSSVINKSLSKGKNTVVLVDHLDMIDNLKKHLRDYDILDPVIITGLTDENYKKIENFNRNITPLMIGSSVLGEGVNLKPVDTLIIAMPSKSKPLFIQQVGRGLRNFPGKTQCNVVFFDYNHRIFKNQLQERLDHCSDFGEFGEVTYYD